MRDVFEAREIPEHLQEFFEPVGGGSGVASARRNNHPT